MSQIGNRMLIKEKLSDNDKLVLYSLAKFPHLADNEIYEKFGFKKSTFSTIKNKLEKNGFYYTIRVPILQHIGCELLVVTYATLNRTTTIEQRMEVARKYWNQIPEDFYLLSESNQAINIAIGENITNFERNFENINQVYEIHDFLDSRGFVTVLFPFDISYAFSFFDYAPLLNRIFNLNLEENKRNINICSEKIKCRVKKREMSSMEKKIYYSLVKYPNLSDAVLAEKINYSRYKITKNKEKFYEEKLMRTTRIINLENLGLEILAFTHSKFNPKKIIEQRKISIDKVTQFMTPIFSISKNLECIRIAAFKNFKDYQAIHDTVTRFCIESDLLKEEPYTMLLSVPRMTYIKNHIYAPLVKEILDHQ